MYGQQNIKSLINVTNKGLFLIIGNFCFHSDRLSVGVCLSVGEHVTSKLDKIVCQHPQNGDKVSVH